MCKQKTPQPAITRHTIPSPESTPRPHTPETSSRSWVDVVKNRPRRQTPPNPSINHTIDLSNAFDAESDDQIGSYPNSKNNESADHVTPDDDKSCDAPSPLTQNDSTASKQQTVSNEETLKTIKNKRNKWTREEMKELVLCYYLGKHKKLPKIKGTFTIWRERNKNLHLNITAIPLNTQLNFILKQKMSKDEIRQIEIDSNCNENCTIAPTPAIVHNQHEDSCSDPIAKNTNDDYDLLVATYSAEIRTKYEECKNMEISKRAMPLKLQYIFNLLKNLKE